MSTVLTVSDLRRERKQLRKALERVEQTRDDACVLAGTAISMLGIACDLLAATTGHTREHVIRMVAQAERQAHGG